MPLDIKNKIALITGASSGMGKATCASEYVTDFFNNYTDNPKSGLMSDWTCRLFSEE